MQANSITQIHSFGKMIGKSEKIKEIFNLIAKVSPSAVNVLLMGESGTGKEIVASTIHEHSKRSSKPFVPINCSAIPEHLLESELFGHKKGSFTGAQEARIGLFEAASGGTVFLDEIGDMPLDLQAKLLRVIQEREIKPIGENRPRAIDVRIIAATHKNLEEMIAKGKFREDLYYRLSVVPIYLPSLRDRREDIPLLATYFLNKFCAENEIEKKFISESAIDFLMKCPWHGNIRELENMIERAVVLSESVLIGVPELQPEVERKAQNTTDLLDFSKLMTLEELEKSYIRYVLSETKLSKDKAAHILGINRKTLYRKEIEYGFKQSHSMVS